MIFEAKAPEIPSRHFLDTWIELGMTQQNDSTAAAAPGNSRWQIFAMTLIAILIGVYEEELDPFGLDSATDQLSANIYSTITSPFYGKTAEKIELQIKTTEQEHNGESENKHSTKKFASRWGQSNVIVLLIDDYYLDKTEQTWPLDPRRYRQVLASLVEAEASAVFLDIYFNQDSEKRVKQVASLFKESRELAVEPDVVFVKIGGYSTYLEDKCRAAEIPCETLVFEGDYYALPNLVPLLTRRSRLELLAEILETPLPERPDRN